MPKTIPPDIRDRGTITHEDVLSLNFIREPSPYYFRGHFREGLRSRIIQVLDPRDVRVETHGLSFFHQFNKFRRSPIAFYRNVLTCRLKVLADIYQITACLPKV